MSDIVIVMERSDGNETVGQTWLETAIFDHTTSLQMVLEWASEHGGVSSNKTIITVPSSISTKF